MTSIASCPRVCVAMERRKQVGLQQGTSSFLVNHSVGALDEQIQSMHDLHDRFTKGPPFTNQCQCFNQRWQISENRPIAALRDAELSFHPKWDTLQPFLRR